MESGRAGDGPRRAGRRRHGAGRRLGRRDRDARGTAGRCGGRVQRGRHGGGGRPDRLNLREGPGLSYDVVTVLTRGTQVTITDGPKPANDYTWFKIETVDGTAGWLIGEGLTQGGGDSGGDFNAGDRVVVADGPLNLRASAGTDASVIATLDQGTKLTITGGPTSANGFTWYQAKTTDATSGWVAGEFLAASSGGDNGGNKGGDNGGDFSPYDRVQVATDALNLRAAAGTDADVIAVLTEGDRATVLDGPTNANGYTWYKVIANDATTGWVAGEYLAAASGGGGIAVGGKVKVVDGRLNLRAAAGTDAKVLDVMPDGTILTVQGGPTSANGYTWYQVANSDYGPGWAAGEFLQPVSTQ